MKLTFKEVGPIESGEIELGKLTILCGKNNTGKTYISYIIYGALKRIRGYCAAIISKKNLIHKTDEGVRLDLEELYENLRAIEKMASDSFLEDLPYIFNVNEKFFSGSNLTIENLVDMDNKEVFYQRIKTKILKLQEFLGFYVEVCDNVVYVRKEEDEPDDIERVVIVCVLSAIGKETADLSDELLFFLPAERCGLNMFYKELNVYRNSLLYEMLGNRKKNMNGISKYPLPISDYILFLNQLNESSYYRGKKSVLSDELEKNIIGGKYFISESGEIRFRHKEKEDVLDFHMASSVAKSLFGLDYYLKISREKRGCLIVDEPEQNLHPDNQRKLARLLAKVVNRGIDVMISTHSDYVVREVNNLIQLGRKFRGYEQIMEKYGYTESELLNVEDVKGYFLNEHRITPMEMEQEGLVVEHFDQVINSMNQVADDIYYAT